MENIFENIAQLVPEGEAAFEPQAVGEGIWVTATHLQAIENALQLNVNELATQKEATTQVLAQVETANAALVEAQANLATANTTIEALNAEVATLKAKTALPIAPPAPLANDDLAPKVETLATAKTQWDLELEAERAKLKS
ncbi:hypothetical protein ACFOW1_01715 [Parasediminibacterium paludis]|uniref:Uncharacterized protein n=1 Tax=Parasediminibacterium paludis TaxID=908966 RepID=A0ABV8PR39_9BACT